MENARLMGYETDLDKKVPVSVRDWNAQKLALWRSRGFSEIVVREAEGILERCAHLEGCPGATDEKQPCLSPRFVKDKESGAEVRVDGCSDREQRASALVILNAARQMAPADARRPTDQPFIAPSREYYSEVLAALGATEIENKMLRKLLEDAGIEVPDIASNSNEGGASSNDDEPKKLEEPS